MNLTPQEQTFFSNAILELVSKKVNFEFTRTKSIDGCSGYFDHTGPTLKVAYWKKNWFSIFIHEFNHFKQWRNNSHFWKQSEGTNFLNNFNHDEMLVTQLLEQECDMMRWKDIQTYNIPNNKNYISHANAYHAAYKNMADNKVWFKNNKSPYDFEEITKLCPNDRFWTKDELQNPKESLYNKINELCF